MLPPKYDDIRRGEIPVGTNAQIEKFATVVDCPDLLEVLKAIEKRKAFGDVSVIDATGFRVLEAKFQSGVFNQGYLEREIGHSKIKRPLVVRFRESVRSDKVSFRKANTNGTEV